MITWAGGGWGGDLTHTADIAHSSRCRVVLQLSGQTWITTKSNSVHDIKTVQQRFQGRCFWQVTVRQRAFMFHMFQQEHGQSALFTRLLWDDGKCCSHFNSCSFMLFWVQVATETHPGFNSTWTQPGPSLCTSTFSYVPVYFGIFPPDSFILLYWFWC